MYTFFFIFIFKRNRISNPNNSFPLLIVSYWSDCKLISRLHVTLFPRYVHCQTRNFSSCTYRYTNTLRDSEKETLRPGKSISEAYTCARRRWGKRDLAGARGLVIFSADWVSRVYGERAKGWAIDAIINRFCFSRSQSTARGPPMYLFIAGFAFQKWAQHTGCLRTADAPVLHFDRHCLSIKPRRAPLTVSTAASAFVNHVPCSWCSLTRMESTVQYRRRRRRRRLPFRSPSDAD